MGKEMTLQRKRRIFISYQRQHEEDIVALVHVLEQDTDFEVWYDQKMKAGKWWEQIITHIEWADVVILALSRSYFDSEACRRERRHAEATKRAILPVVVDRKLDYSEIPKDIVEYQIDRYFGQADQYFELRQNLVDLPINPLPDPIPTPPEAPIGTPKKNPVHSRGTVMGAVAALVVVSGLVLLLTSAMFGPALDDETPAPVATSAQVATSNEDSTPTPDEQVIVAVSTASPTIPAAVEQVAEGAMDFILIYGERSSLAIVVNNVTDFNGVTLRAFDPEYETTLIRDFPALQATGALVTGNICLIYEVDDTDARRPQACDDAQILLAPLRSADVFWFNDRGNRFIDIAVYRGGALVRLCGHGNGSGRCEIAFDPI